MRKLLIIIVLCLFMAGQFGYYALYSYQQSELKEAMKERMLAGLPDSVLQIMDEKDLKADIEWEQEGKEFSLAGKMYDVVKTVQQNGKVYYYCINDDQEEEMLNSFSRIVNSVPENNPTGKPAHQLIKFKITDLTISDPYNVPVFFTVPIHQWIISGEDILAYGIVRIQTPPPRHFTA